MQRSPLHDLRYALWFPLYLLTYLIMEQVTPASYWSSQIPIDQLIPFCEWFVIPYTLWYPLLIGVGVYLLLRAPASFRRYMWFLALTFFLSAAIWLLIPNGQDLRPITMPCDNLLTAMISVLYAIDTNTNVFPSVHVVGSLGAIFAVWDCRVLRRTCFWLCWAVSILAVLICLSTIFIKQHAVLDVVSGIILSLLVAFPIYFANCNNKLDTPW